MVGGTEDTPRKTLIAVCLSASIKKCKYRIELMDLNVVRICLALSLRRTVVCSRSCRANDCSNAAFGDTFLHDSPGRSLCTEGRWLTEHTSSHHGHVSTKSTYCHHGRDTFGSTYWPHPNQTAIAEFRRHRAPILCV